MASNYSSVYSFMPIYVFLSDISVRRTLKNGLSADEISAVAGAEQV